MADIPDFTILPGTFTFHANPGDTVENIVRLENTSSVPLFLQVRITGAKQFDSAGHVRADSTQKHASWVTVENSGAVRNETIELAPNSITFVPFTLKVPENITSGSYLWMVGFVSKNGIVKTQKGTVLYLDLGSELRPKLAMESYQQKLKLPEFWETSLLLRFKNKGNTTAIPKGEIVVTDLFGNTVSKTPVFGIFIPSGSPKWEQRTSLPLFIPGVYRANIRLSYDLGKRYVSSETLIVTPVLILFVIVVVLGGCAYIAKHIHHHVKRHFAKKRRNHG